MTKLWNVVTVRNIAAALAALAVVATASAPALAVTKGEKAKTCAFGADDQKLTGAKRKAFIAKCMSNKNDPRGAPAPASN